MRAPILLAVLFASVSPRAEAENLPAISFPPFPLPTVRTYILAQTGTPASQARFDDPVPNDFPPGVVVFLEDARKYPSLAHGRSIYAILGRNVVRVYDISEVKKAPYKTIQPQLEQLRELLKTRPIAVPSGEKQGDHYNSYVQLPDYPPRNAGHMLQAKLSYLDADWGSGLFYITQFVQGTGEQPDNERLTYIFQGLSKDGKYYVSADFRIEHKLLRSFKKDADPDKVTEQVEATFPKQTDDSFSPSLRAIRKWVSGLAFK